MSNCEIAVAHDLVFHEVLDFLDARAAREIFAFFSHDMSDGLDLQLMHLYAWGSLACLANRIFYFSNVEIYFFTASFDNFHR